MADGFSPYYAIPIVLSFFLLVSLVVYIRKKEWIGAIGIVAVLATLNGLSISYILGRTNNQLPWAITISDLLANMPGRAVAIPGMMIGSLFSCVFQYALVIDGDSVALDPARHQFQVRLVVVLALIQTISIWLTTWISFNINDTAHYITALCAFGFGFITAYTILTLEYLYYKVHEPLRTMFKVRCGILFFILILSDGQIVAHFMLPGLTTYDGTTIKDLRSIAFPFMEWTTFVLFILFYATYKWPFIQKLVKRWDLIRRMKTCDWSSHYEEFRDVNTNTPGQEDDEVPPFRKWLPRKVNDQIREWPIAIV